MSKECGSRSPGARAGRDRGAEGATKRGQRALRPGAGSRPRSRPQPARQTAAWGGKTQGLSPSTHANVGRPGAARAGTCSACPRLVRATRGLGRQPRTCWACPPHFGERRPGAAKAGTAKAAACGVRNEAPKTRTAGGRGRMGRAQGAGRQAAGGPRSQPKAGRARVSEWRSDNTARRCIVPYGPTRPGC